MVSKHQLMINVPHHILGVNYRGVLACLDGFMNIAMEQTEEYADGHLKARYGDCFIRGNNGECVFIFHVFEAFTNACANFTSSFIH